MIKTEESEFECPLCMEYLSKNVSGKMTLKNRIEIDVYTCEECEQAFGYDLGQMKLLPYDSSMKKIENKCNLCNVVKNYNEHGKFILNIDTAFYDFHCMECAIKVLREWVKKNCKESTIVNEETIHELYELYDFHKNNEMLKELNDNPEKYKKTIDKIKYSFGRVSKTEPKGNEE